MSRMIVSAAGLPQIGQLDSQLVPVGLGELDEL
jgi:hypothetical protein